MRAWNWMRVIAGDYRSTYSIFGFDVQESPA